MNEYLMTCEGSQKSSVAFVIFRCDHITFTCFFFITLLHCLHSNTSRHYRFLPLACAPSPEEGKAPNKADFSNQVKTYQWYKPPILYRSVCFALKNRSVMLLIMRIFLESKTTTTRGCSTRRQLSRHHFKSIFNQTWGAIQYRDIGFKP